MKSVFRLFAAALAIMVAHGCEERRLDAMAAAFHEGRNQIEAGDMEAGTASVRIAAEAGMHEAQIFLGRLYDRPEEDGGNFKEAVRWKRAAAEQGDVASQLWLAAHLDLATREDAYKWLLVAKAQGATIAAEEIAKIVSGLSEQQKATAEAAAASWRPKTPQDSVTLSARAEPAPEFPQSGQARVSAEPASVPSSVQPLLADNPGPAWPKPGLYDLGYAVVSIGGVTPPPEVSALVARDAEQDALIEEWHSLDLDLDGTREFVAGHTYQFEGTANNFWQQLYVVGLSASGWRIVHSEGVGSKFWGTVDVGRLLLANGILSMTVNRMRDDDAFCCPSDQGELAFDVGPGGALTWKYERSQDQDRKSD
jgi:hypothetical protein